MTTIGGGSLDDARGSVRWRLGSSPRAAQSATALDWVRELADDLGLPTQIAPRVGRAKPRFAEATDADFSVSHSGELLLVAVAGCGPIGVDIEAGPFDAFESVTLARRLCTPSELAECESVTGPARTRHLARLWTAKEARTKATGAGLTVDFRTIPALLGDEHSVTLGADVPTAEICIARSLGPSWRLTPASPTHVATCGRS